MTILHLHSEPVRTEWLDAYGHLGGVYYNLAFEPAGWRLADHFGIGEDYFKRTECALYLVESHVRYLKEVRAPAQLEFEGMVLGTDEKRNWYGIVMSVDGIECATWEYVEVHVDTRLGRAVPKPPDVQAAMRSAAVKDRPPWAGRAISLERR